MSIPQRVLKEWEESQGVDRLGPIVTFYDHALPDNESARDYVGKGKWEGERPRFKPAVFVRMQTRNDPTGSTWCDKATREHSEQYPKEWQRYLEGREQLDNRAPPITAIHNMNPVAFEELRALGIADCRELVEYDGDLDSLEPMRATAKRIMEISSENSNDGYSGDVREGRQSVSAHVERPVHGDSASGGYGQAAIPTGLTGGGAEVEGGIGPVPSNHQSREGVQTQATGKRLVPGAPVEVFKYEFAA